MFALLNTISDFLKPETLYHIIAFFAVITIVFVCLIFWYLWQKKKNFFLRKAIQKSFELWLSKIMLEEDESENIPFHIPAKFTKHFKNPAKRQFLIDELITMKRNFTGGPGDNLIKLYLQLGLKKDSLSKFQSLVWHKKAKGINELYVMHQEDMIPKIFKHTNNANEFVRMEAQTAMISFLGFEGLRFLDVVTFPISDWQQVKILEQLRPLDVGEMKNLDKWLSSSNDTVIIFALKLADIYQQFQVYEQVVKCLGHQDEKIRVQAVQTMVRIEEEDTASTLAEQYFKEKFTNRLNILNNIIAVASDKEKGFLLRQLDDENDFLKLGAARVIGRCCTNGMEMLQQKALAQPQPYEQIYHHVKRELAR